MNSSPTTKSLVAVLLSLLEYFGFSLLHISVFLLYNKQLLSIIKTGKKSIVTQKSTGMRLNLFFIE